MRHSKKIITPCLILLVSVCFRCSDASEISLEAITEDYYQTYNQRQDIEDLLAFYSDSLVLEDMITGDVIRGKEELKKFFDWSNPNFKLVNANTLIITGKVVGQHQVVVSGHYEPFMWGTSQFEAMHFTTILTFGLSGKITHHKDWINYPNNLLNYEKRKNANDRINN